MTPSALSDPDPDQRAPARTPIDPAGPSDTGSRPTAPEMPAAPEVVAAFSAFYREAVPRLVAFLRWHGAPLPDAADCVQDTLAACLRAWTAIDEPYPWCRTVAVRRYARLVAAVREWPVDIPDAAGEPGRTGPLITRDRVSLATPAAG